MVCKHGRNKIKRVFNLKFQSKSILEFYTLRHFLKHLDGDFSFTASPGGCISNKINKQRKIKNCTSRSFYTWYGFDRFCGWLYTKLLIEFSVQEWEDVCQWGIEPLAESKTTRLENVSSSVVRLQIGPNMGQA